MQIYENLLDLSHGMLAAARNAEWEHLLELEQDCRRLVDQLLASDQAEPMSEALHRRRREIIRRMLIEDAQIRDLTDPALARNSAFLSSPGLPSCLPGRGDPG